ncbi:MAG: tetratricopeptide repeat protein [Candidatus Sumerlaeota bacterium]|nr:tetratricopeptide repeat protein [Candidatus Sumerlaeota bacterium]
MGRAAEGRQLQEAVSRGDRVIAVVGVAGQGKSSLLSRWYEEDPHALPGGVGLFWCSPYQGSETRSRYPFDDFLDDLLQYFTGQPVDRQNLPRIEDRLKAALRFLQAHPCRIVLDGMERWLRRWARDPDAGAENLAADDCEPEDPAFRAFLEDVGNWTAPGGLILATRALPRALRDQDIPHTAIAARGEELEGLLPEDAVVLLGRLEVHGNPERLKEAAVAYQCHPFAIRILGRTLHRLHGGDIEKWPAVDTSRGDLGELLDKALALWPEDRPLLDLAACSVGPAPVAMAAELLNRPEAEVRDRLWSLDEWGWLDSRGPDITQHTVIRKHLLTRLGDGSRGIRKHIAGWWKGRRIPDRPQYLEEILPLLRAVDHLVAAKEVKRAWVLWQAKPATQSDYPSLDEWLFRFGHLEEHNRVLNRVIDSTEDLVQEGRPELRTKLASAYNNRGLALAVQGRLDEAIEDVARAVGIYEALVEGEGRRELRNALAGTHSNRGLALTTQGRLDEAIEDHGRAIEIYEALVKGEGRRELRNDLASSYNNRGNALADQGRLNEAIEDYGRAIGIREALVEREGRRELRNDLAIAYNNRAIALRQQGRLDEAIENYDRAIGIWKALVEDEGRRELRNDLATAYNNRGIALRRLGRLDEAIEDDDRAIGIYEALVEGEGRRELAPDLETTLRNRAIALVERKEWSSARCDLDKAADLLQPIIAAGQRHHLPSFLKAVGFRCLHVGKMGEPEHAAAWANQALRWLIEELEAGRVTPVLRQAVPPFRDALAQNRSILERAGLDKALLDRALARSPVGEGA